MTADVLLLASDPPAALTVTLPAIVVAPSEAVTLNLLVLYANVVPLSDNKLSPIVFPVVAFGIEFAVKLASVPYVPAVTPTILLDCPLEPTCIQ